MTMIEGAYSTATAALAPALALIPRTGKVGAAAAGMRMALGGFRKWASSNRVADRDLVWFHAPSVGEGFQAQAVMKSLRALRPDLQIAYTFFSPSAVDFARFAPADVAGFLPPDTRANARAMLDALRPAAVVFVKTEIWPALVRECSERGIPTLLLSATLPAGSSRLRTPTRVLLTASHARLSRVGAISDEDSQRFAELGVDATRRVVAGDARFDQVVQRAGRRVFTRPDVSAPLLVAGSTWPVDEAVLLEALARLNAAGLELNAILVPHEPTPQAVRRLRREIGTRGFDSTLWSELPEPPDGATVAGRLTPRSVMIVDRLGVLGSLYGMAEIAWVGGGFGTAGIHSVLEPAAFGIPVLFGPGHANAREAGQMIDTGAAFAVNNGEELAVRLVELIETPELRSAAGARATDYMNSKIGAAEKGAHLILHEIDGEATPPS